MGVFWLAVDKDCSSYLELKYRMIVAQGWSRLKNLVSLQPFYPNHEDLFKQNIKALGDIGYKNKEWFHRDNCGEVMWNLIKLKKGDLVIALEGRTVKGICEMPSDGIESYRFDEGFEYANTVGFGVKWVDWSENTFGFTPNPKAIPFGIERVVNDKERVIEAWKAYQNPQFA